MKAKNAVSITRGLNKNIARLFSTNYDNFGKQNLSSDSYRTDIFYHRDLEIVRAPQSQLKSKPGPSVNLKFGHFFSDHMFEAHWSTSKGWARPLISPMHDILLHPGAKVLHYAIQLFEGMKAYRGTDNKIRLFRPDMNMQRMKRSAARSSLPDFSTEELTKIIYELVKLDQEWVPHSTTSALYIRPTFIGTDPTLGVGHSNNAMLFVLTGPTGSYYSTGFNPISLLADPDFVRAFPGGVGAFKMGCNYAPTILLGKIAAEKGCQQVLWLYGEEENITEVGTMNIFIYWKNEQGEDELLTPPITDGLILPGVTRDSLLVLARDWNEFKVSEQYIGMNDIKRALKEKRLYEMFGAGTACVVSPVGRILYKNKATKEYEEILLPTVDHKPSLMQRFYDYITDVQFGRMEHPGWIVEVE